MTSMDKLCIAISIVQQNILAQDSALIPDRLFGPDYMRTGALEMAVRLMCECLGDLEDKG